MRFTREAQTLAALNHPHIAQICGVEEGQVGQVGQVRAAVRGNRLSGELRAFDIMPDGRFVGVATATDDRNRGNLMQIRVLVNWLEEFADALRRD